MGNRDQKGRLLADRLWQSHSLAVVLICFMQTVSEYFGVMKLFQELLFGCHLLMFISIFVSQSSKQATPTHHANDSMKIISRDAL